MTRHTSTASTRTRTIDQLLTVAMTAVIIAIIACSGDQPPPTHRPQTEDRSPMQTIEAMAVEIAALQTKAAEPTETTGDDGRRPTKEPSTAVAPATATATETPEPTATLPPPPRHRPSDNICRRSPRIQYALMDKFRLSSCSIITVDELFRLDRDFAATLNESPRQGDFAGMTNLKELRITVEIPEGETGTIPEQLFHGMTKLENLVLISKGMLTISSNAVHNLPELESLSIYGSGNLTINNGFISKVPNLKELKITMGGGSSLDNQILKNINRVTMLEVGATSVRADAFMNLPALETLSIGAQRVTLKDDSFSKNPKLQSIEISASTSGHRTAFAKLEKLNYLSLNNRSDSSRKPEIILSPKSPLMKAILNGQSSPKGYIVIPPGGE